MRKIAVILVVLAVILPSCKTVEYVDRVRKEYETRIIVDSTFIDCTDSVFIFQKGDTVTIKEVKTRLEYRYKLLTDTLIQADTLTIYKEMTNCTENAKKPFRWLKFGFILGIIIIFALYITIKFLKR